VALFFLEIAVRTSGRIVELFAAFFCIQGSTRGAGVFFCRGDLWADYCSQCRCKTIVRKKLGPTQTKVKRVPGHAKQILDAARRAAKLEPYNKRIGTPRGLFHEGKAFSFL
jgi:hypothetical protein